MPNEKFKNRFRIPSARATWHNYNAGTYFVTICTQNREHYFGEIQKGEMILSEMGIIAKQCLKDIPSHFQHVKVPLSVVMPNHVHAIVIIDSIYDRPVETQNFASLQFGPQSKNLASIIRGFKIGVKKYATLNAIPFAWQTRFHDHIVRNTDELNRIATYIQNNVAQWESDRYHDLP